MPQSITRVGARIAELQQVASAASALETFNSSMNYSTEHGRSEHKASAAAYDAPERPEFSQRLRELVACRQAVAAAQVAVEAYTAGMAYYAEAGRAEHASAAPVAGPTADLEDKRERLAELVHKLEVAQAAAAYADTLACAEPCGRAEHAHTYTAAPLGLADFQERLSELCTAAAVVPEWAAYAEPGRALRCGAAPTEAPLSLADFADRLAELERREAACAACAALADSLGYIDACGRAEHARSYTAAPLDLDDLAERLAELEAKAAVVPEWCAYAEGGRAQRKANAPTPEPLSLADMRQCLNDLVQKDTATRALAAFADSVSYAEQGRPARKAGAPTPAPLDLADMAERLAELAAKAAAVPSWAAYAEPLPLEASTPRKVAGACRSEVQGLAYFQENLQDLIMTAQSA